MRISPLLVASLAAALLAGCATPPPPSLTRPVQIASALAHGADSTRPLDERRFSFARGCLYGEPAFWGRYFNHSDLPERDRRPDVSFASDVEPQEFKRRRLKLLPIFAQNLNDMGEAEGRVHGEINARDLIAAVGAQRLVRHMAQRPLYVVLNEETPSGVLTADHYAGWVAGFSATLSAIGADGAKLRPIVYGNINAEPELKWVLEELHAERWKVPYAGFWRARIDPDLQTGRPPATCGRLADWHRYNDDWNEQAHGPLLIRQYLLDAEGGEGVAVDLNALNPRHAAALLDGMLSFDD